MNQIIAAAKLRMPYMSMKRLYTNKVIRMLDQYDIKRCKSPIHLKFVWLEPDRRRDPDNICAGSKFILDGMVKAKIIKSDGFKHVLSIKSFFNVNKDGPGVLVEIKNDQ